MQKVSFPIVGGQASGELLLPEKANHGSLVIVHEWWGVNDDVRRIAARFASEGYAALAIDLYHGQWTTDPAEAMRLSSELQTALAMKEIQGAVRFLAAHDGSNQKVGVTGFCLGGAMALASAFNVEGLAASLPFYGNPRPDFVHFDKKTPPIQGHYAKNDAFIDIAKTRAIADGVRAHGGVFELFEYDAGHAFMREADPAAYDEPSSKLAWERALGFLRTSIG